MVDISGDFWKGKRVLITGHTGFKGSWLSLWLLKLGAEVYGYSLSPTTSPNLFTLLFDDYFHGCSIQNQFFELHDDIRDYDTLSSFVRHAQPEIIFHLAAQPIVRESYIDPLGTWSSNVMGSLNLLESLRCLNGTCAVVMITTDKVYENRSWLYGYRESDILGGHDPYSASKAASELAISSWRSSYCGESELYNLRIASARAGNVIGGGDWSPHRIVPDVINSIIESTTVKIRNPLSTRPWQHVLEPLSGYLMLANQLFENKPSCTEAFNFGPTVHSNCSVQDLVETIFSFWNGSWEDCSSPNSLHEAHTLHLQADKAFHVLGWQPHWDYVTTIKKTVLWYRSLHNSESAYDCCMQDLQSFTSQNFDAS